MSIAKDLWLSLYEEARAEYDRAGMPEAEADQLAANYAERELPNALADKADEADYHDRAEKEAYIK